VNSEARRILDELIEGNQRFREGRGSANQYGGDRIVELSTFREPKAAVLACSDSRVSPEAVFDHPLGTLFVSRVPGNVAADSAKWMLEIAVANLQVALVVVMGHTDCLAVKQVVDGEVTGAGGLLRFAVSTAVLRAKMKQPENLFHEAVVQNALQARDQLVSDSWALGQAIVAGQTAIVVGVYDVFSGEFRLLE